MKDKNNNINWRKSIEYFLGNVDESYSSSREIQNLFWFLYGKQLNELKGLDRFGLEYSSKFEIKQVPQNADNDCTEVVWEKIGVMICEQHEEWTFGHMFSLWKSYHSPYDYILD